MPRRRASERHLPTSPVTTGEVGGETGNALLDVLTAFHHPTRRWLCELLAVEGPATVGMLARRTDLAVGSVSHHLGTLHRHGFVEPAPELARDTRESWWRSRPRQVSWESTDYGDGTVARRIAATAEAENFRHHVRAVQRWLAEGESAAPEVRRAAVATDTLMAATVEQMAELSRRFTELVVEWSEECRADAGVHPGAERLPVRVSARVFPSGPVKP
ncbi:ArsR/SmtB family transcription factor [Terrabacter aerolatus]|nr:helix-turn-helix domain-containing protein [Terrabacter aerolatus]